MPDDVPDYIRRANRAAEPTPEPEPAEAPETPPAPQTPPEQQGHVPQWKQEFPDGVQPTDPVAKIDRYLTLRFQHLRKLQADLDREMREDGRLLSADRSVRTPVRDYYQDRQKNLREQFRQFSAEQSLLGAGRRDTVRQRKVRAEQRAKGKGQEQWLKRTRDDYQKLYGAKSGQEARKMMEADKQAAQGGDLEAYLRLNGYCTGDENQRLELDDCHHEMIQTYTADLLCWPGKGGCGRPHLQEIRKQNPDGSLQGPTCPHCGLQNCHGPMNAKVKVPRGLGKTEIEAHDFSMRVGMYIQRSRWPRAVILGDNDQEAALRAEMVSGVMSRPGHAYCFDRQLPPHKDRPHNYACVPKPKHQKGKITFFGRTEPVIVSYGLLGCPPGYHADLFWCDDVVNYKNSFLKPGFIKDIILAWSNVTTKSTRPWTHITWTGTPWRENDLEAVLDEEARGSPERWSYCLIACGGPEDDFSTPSPKQLPKEYLRDQWELQQRTGDKSYDRAFRMLTINTDLIAFREFHYYVHMFTGDDPPHNEAVSQARIPVLHGAPKDLQVPKLMAVDVGFTGPGAEKKGRSMTGMVIGGLGEHFAWVYEALEDYLTPRQVRDMPLEWCAKCGCQELVLPQGPAMDGLAEHFSESGLTVHRISESELGDKTLRKFPIAETHNAGLVRLRAWPNLRKNGVEINVAREVRPLEDACRMFPAQVCDVLDAYEFWRVMLWRLYGPPELAPREDIGDPVPVSRFKAHEDALYAQAQQQLDAEREARLAGVDEKEQTLSEIGNDLLAFTLGCDFPP